MLLFYAMYEDMKQGEVCCFPFLSNCRKIFELERKEQLKMLLLFLNYKKVKVVQYMKIAVLVNNTSGTIQEHCRLDAGVIDSHQQARSAILNYIRSKEQFGPTPVDIGQFGQGRSGGKGKYTSFGTCQGNYNSDDTCTDYIS